MVQIVIGVCKACVGINSITVTAAHKQAAAQPMKQLSQKVSTESPATSVTINKMARVICNDLGVKHYKKKE